MNECGQHCIGKSKGAPPVHTPYGSRFFPFSIQILWKQPCSKLTPPLYEVNTPPATGNPGSTAAWLLTLKKDHRQYATANAYLVALRMYMYGYSFNAWLVTWSAWTNKVWHATEQFHGRFKYFILICWYYLVGNYFVSSDPLVFRNYSGLIS